MNFIVDAQLPPALARWPASRFGVQAHHVRELSLRDAEICATGSVSPIAGSSGRFSARAG